MTPSRAALLLTLALLAGCKYREEYNPPPLPDEQDAGTDGGVILPETKLGAHTRHFFDVTGGPATHLRLEIFPDGGVSRLRAWGQPSG